MKGKGTGLSRVKCKGTGLSGVKGKGTDLSGMKGKALELDTTLCKNLLLCLLYNVAYVCRQTLEKQLMMKDQVYTGTQTAVTNLEMHHVAGLTDLRGRVVRCDTAISQLSADLKFCTDSIKSLGHERQQQETRIMSRLQRVDDRV